MNKIYATILLIALSSKLFAQTSTNGYVPNKIVNWEPYNSYIIAGVAATLGAIVSTKYPVEITTQAGPSINWFRNDQVSFNEFYSPLNTKIDFGHIWGYSAGITIGTARPGLNVKSGVFLESKGRSYSSSGFVTTYVQQDGYGYNKEIWIETQGTSRLNSQYRLWQAFRPGKARIPRSGIRRHFRSIWEALSHYLYLNTT